VAVTIDTHPSAEDLQQIEHILIREQQLTPRRLATLQQSDIAVARDGDAIVGWLVSEHLGRNVYELGAAFVLPTYRRKGILGRLIDALTRDDATYVAALFSLQLSRYLCEHKNFSETTLMNIVRVSRGKFVTKRLSQSARVAGHLRAQKAVFIIRSAQQ
jgi:GNAT superfamily N-acetyltransferase